MLGKLDMCFLFMSSCVRAHPTTLCTCFTTRCALRKSQQTMKLQVNNGIIEQGLVLKEKNVKVNIIIIHVRTNLRQDNKGGRAIYKLNVWIGRA